VIRCQSKDKRKKFKNNKEYIPGSILTGKNNYNLPNREDIIAQVALPSR